MLQLQKAEKGSTCTLGEFASRLFLNHRPCREENPFRFFLSGSGILNRILFHRNEIEIALLMGSVNSA